MQRYMELALEASCAKHYQMMMTAFAVVDYLTDVYSSVLPDLVATFVTLSQTRTHSEAVPYY